MALEENGGNGIPAYMPVGPAGMNGGFGNGFGGEGWWVILLFFLLAGGGWGNGFGGNGGGGMYPWLNQSNQINDGFRDQMLATQVANMQTALTGGFGDLQTALCGGFAGVNAGISNGFAQAEIANNARQMADMNQNFGMQTAMMQGFNGMQSQLAQCCCDNRLATCQTQNLVSTESAATRATIQAGVQSVLDKMCQDKIDEKNEKINELNNQINALQANNYVQNALTAQTQYFLSLYPPTAEAARANAATGA